MTTFSPKLDWTELDVGDGLFAYCADGDGIVAVYTNGNYFEVREQGDVIATFIVLDSALERAEQLLLNDYPAIYEDCLA